MLRHGKLLDLLFSLEVFIKFIDRYVKNDSVFKEHEIKKLFNRTINGLKKEEPVINIDEINLIQRLFRSGLKLESTNDDWLVVLNRTQTEIINYKDPEIPIPADDRDGFIGFILAVQFITVVNFDDSGSLLIKKQYK